MLKQAIAHKVACVLTGLFVATFAVIVLSGLVLVVAMFGSAAFAANTPGVNESCLTCHGNKDLVTTSPGKTVSLFIDPAAYQSSVHGGKPCTACHLNVDSIPHKNPVYGPELSLQTMKQCAACHSSQTQQHESSVHGLSLPKGEEVTCNSCHGDSHGVMPTNNVVSPVSRQNLAQTCTACHNNQVAVSYQQSFHGTALSLGYDKAASCVDCHGTHDVLQANDPRSKVAPQNLPATCVRCHGGQPTANWANGKEHVTPADKKNAFPLWIVWKIFLLLILVDALQGGSVILLELLRQLRWRLRFKHQLPHRQETNVQGGKQL